MIEILKSIVMVKKNIEIEHKPEGDLQSSKYTIETSKSKLELLKP